jgi:TPR repeat protein/uncharacterized caspase-like protein
MPRPTGWIRVVGFLTAVSLFPGASPARADDKPKPLGEKYALLIGVRRYDENELRPLQFAEADVVQLAQVLRDAGYRPENVTLLTQTRGAENHRFLPLAANIRKELRLLLKNRTRADSVIVAFAGHGVEFRGSADHYFCPMDAALSDKQTLISLNEVYKELERCRAGVKLLLADACRNDPVADHSRRVTADLTSVSRPQTAPPPGGVAALFSCSAGELAFEHDELKHGVFFHFLIQGLRGEADLDGDRTVSLPELDLYVRKRVSDFVRGKYGREQNPNLVGNTRGVVPLVTIAQVKKAFLGVRFGTEATFADRLKAAGGEDVYLEGVVPGSAAERVGLRAGDVLLAVNGQGVRSHRSEAITGINSMEPGSAVTLDIERSGKRLQLRAVVEPYPTPAETAARYRKAAERGEAWAQRDLAKMYADGRGVPYDEAESVKWYRQAAEQGDVESSFRVGYAHTKGKGVAQDNAAAAPWYRQAAEKGHGMARNNLGVLYRDGQGVVRDDAEAVKWLRQAAEQGVPLACVNLGGMYSQGRGVAKDPAEAVKWYRRAADLDFARGQFLLGRSYLTGFGVAKDEAEAVKWLRRAAEQGDSHAQLKLALCYQEGTGVAIDEAEAARWYREAADQGNAAAQNNLGRQYDRGLGVPKDYAEAVRLFREAAEQGNPVGQFNLGLMYAQGNGVPKDESEAVKWHRKSADQGYALAKYRLGLAYAKGRGVAKDIGQAKLLLRKAAEQNDADAKKLLADLEKGVPD